MNAVLVNSGGKIVISKAVLSKIAGYAATKCYGVVDMSPKSGKDGVSRLLRVDNMRRGIKIQIKNNILFVDIFVIAEYGTNVSTVGDAVKHNVKYNLQQSTGMDVGNVNVHIESLRV